MLTRTKEITEKWYELAPSYESAQGQRFKIDIKMYASFWKTLEQKKSKKTNHIVSQIEIILKKNQFELPVKAW